MTLPLLASSSSLPSIFTARPEARSTFCAEVGIVDLDQVEPVYVAAFVELQLKTQSKPTVKARLAALRSGPFSGQDREEAHHRAGRAGQIGSAPP